MEEILHASLGFNRVVYHIINKLLIMLIYIPGGPGFCSIKGILIGPKFMFLYNLSSWLAISVHCRFLIKRCDPSAKAVKLLGLWSPLCWHWKIECEHNAETRRMRSIATLRKHEQLMSVMNPLIRSLPASRAIFLWSHMATWPKKIPWKQGRHRATLAHRLQPIIGHKCWMDPTPSECWGNQWKSSKAHKRVKQKLEENKHVNNKNSPTSAFLIVCSWNTTAFWGVEAFSIIQHGYSTVAAL